jgi:hypothetical protein
MWSWSLKTGNTIFGCLLDPESASELRIQDKFWLVLINPFRPFQG